MTTTGLLSSHPELTSLGIGGLLVLSLLIRYVVMAGGAMALLHIFRKPLQLRRIQRQGFHRQQLKREVKDSVVSLTIIALTVILFITVHSAFPIFKVYRDPTEYGWIWLVVSLPIVLMAHDFYFYWAHRLMHTPLLYDRVHKVHHLSTNPSPLASFAFHPLEAIIEVLGPLLIFCLIPTHLGVVAAFSLMTLAFNVMGHLGHELLPRWLATSPVFGFLNTSTSHNQHHRTFRYNYGLYTVLWDRLFGTTHRHYRRDLEHLSSRPLIAGHTHNLPKTEDHVV